MAGNHGVAIAHRSKVQTRSNGQDKNAKNNGRRCCRWQRAAFLGVVVAVPLSRNNGFDLNRSLRVSIAVLAIVFLILNTRASPYAHCIITSAENRPIIPPSARLCVLCTKSFFSPSFLLSIFNPRRATLTHQPWPPLLTPPSCILPRRLQLII
jgi:hypothetical protein